MPSNPFAATAAALPTVLPIFPLSQALVLPGQQLPLNIFEPRYLAMVLDSLGAGRHIGMIQPRPASPDDAQVCLYDVGCAGRITAFQESSDGRLLIQLQGACRFRVAGELEELNGYRRVRPDWQPFLADLGPSPDPGLAAADFEPALRLFADAHGLELPWDGLGQVEPANLVDLLSAQMPFPPQEKQLLLEAPTVVERAQLLLSVLAMPVADHESGQGLRH